MATALTCPSPPPFDPFFYHQLANTVQNALTSSPLPSNEETVKAVHSSLSEETPDFNIERAVQDFFSPDIDKTTSAKRFFADLIQNGSVDTVLKIKPIILEAEKPLEQSFAFELCREIVCHRAQDPQLFSIAFKYASKASQSQLGWVKNELFHLFHAFLKYEKNNEEVLLLVNEKILAESNHPKRYAGILSVIQDLAQYDGVEWQEALDNLCASDSSFIRDEAASLKKRLTGSLPSAS